MKWQSKKQAGMIRKYAKARREYALRGCAICGRGPCDVHEITAGSYRLLAYGNPAFWLPLCRLHHDEWQGLEWERQFALKLEIDPANFDLDEVNRVLAPRRIDAGDVLKWVVRNRLQGGIAA